MSWARAATASDFAPVMVISCETARLFRKLARSFLAPSLENGCDASCSASGLMHQGIFRREVRHRIELQHSSTSIYRSKQISFVWSGNAEMVKEIGLGPPILHLGPSVVAFCIVGDALE